jgi:prepilin-type N-terminal cleavage/methylation domain-containing protein
MKLETNIGLKARPKLMATAGFTLGEMLIAVAIFSLVIAAMVAVQIFGLRVYTLAATKLTATQGGRETLNLIRDQVRSSQQVYVGIYTNSTFAQIAAGSPQQGNALQLTWSTNSSYGNANVVYYQDPATTNLWSVSNNVSTVVANYVTNYICFQAVDYTGTNVLTNYQNNPVIFVTLQFSQWEYPIGYVGGSTNGVDSYDYYYLRARIARRVKDLN